MEEATLTSTAYSEAFREQWQCIVRSFHEGGPLSAGAYRVLGFLFRATSRRDARVSRQQAGLRATKKQKRYSCPTNTTISFALSSKPRSLRWREPFPRDRGFPRAHWLADSGDLR